MADLVITAANVAEGSGAQVVSGIAGETITAGMSVYLNNTTNKWMKAKCAGTVLESGNGTNFGVAMHGSLNNQPLIVQTGGQYTVGATVVVGTLYVISSTYGGIAPITDLASTNKQTILGLGISSTVLDLSYARCTGLTMP